MSRKNAPWRVMPNGREQPAFRRKLRPVLEPCEPRLLLSTATITEYPTPDSFGLGPENIALAPDGTVWFPELSSDALGEFDPTTGSVTSFPLPSTNTSIGSITFGPGGSLWFVNTDGGTPQISELDPATSAITNFPLTAGAIGLAAGNDGNLWFSSDESGLGYINPSTGAIDFDKFPAGFNATAITAAPPDVYLPDFYFSAVGHQTIGIYFSDVPGNSVGALSTDMSTLGEARLQTPDADPNDIAVTPDGTIWYTENALNKVGSLNYFTGDRTEYTLPSSVNGLLALAASPTGDIWFTTHNDGEVGELIPASGDITIYSVPDAPLAALSGIAATPDGDLWFLDNNYGVGEIVPQPVVATRLLTLMTPFYGVSVGQPFNVSVAATDALDQIDTSYDGTVTLSLANATAGQTLGGTLTATAANGIATFTGLTLSQVTTGDTLAATATGPTSTITPSISVGQDSTSMSLSVSPSTASAGQTVTLTATLSVYFPGGGVVTGPVNFYDGGTLLGSTSLVPGSGVETASLTTNLTTNGTHQLSAEFSGNSDYSGSNSRLNYIVTAQTTTTVLSDTLTGTPAAPILTLTATVSPAQSAAEDPTGQVNFVDGTQTLGTGTLATNAAGVTSASITLTDLAVGTYPITAEYVGDSNNDASSSSIFNVVISPATAALAFGALAFTYTGSAQGTTVTTSPAGLSGVSIAYTQNGVAVTAPTAAGTYDVTASLDNPRYVAQPITGTLVISAASPTIDWSDPADITYGTALGTTQLDATATVTADGVTVDVPGTFLYSDPIGTILSSGQNQTITVAFTPFDVNDYSAAYGQVAIGVLPATPQILWLSPAAITYGTVLGSSQLDASASSVVGGTTVSVPGVFEYSPSVGKVLSAGLNQSLSVSFTPSDLTDFASTSYQTTISINPATPWISWPRPAEITYGTPLGPSQLDATASYAVAGVIVNVTGTFVYTQSNGAILDGAQNQTLFVSFIPTDATDYSTASGETTITVGPATPTITWPSPGQISYGTTLTAGQLDASASFVVDGTTVSVPGTFAYAQGAGTVLNAGNDQTLTATFTPSDAADYSTAPASTSINVAPASLTVLAVPTTITAGQPLPNFTATYQGFVLGQGPSVLSGLLNFQTDASSSSSAGTYSVVPTGLFAENYAINYVASTLTILPPPVVVITQVSRPPVIAPVVVEALEWETERLTRKKSVKVLVVDFSGPLNGSDAQDLAAFALDLGKHKKKVGIVYTKPVRLRSVVYSSQTDSVTITPRRKVRNKTMQLTINAALILDSSGRNIDGNRDGVPGGNFVALLNSRTVISL